MLVMLLVGAALALAYANGANDNFKATATLYGSRSLDYGAARGLATAAQVSGSLASVILATGLLRTFSGKGLVPNEIVGDPAFLVCVGSAAALTVWIATRVGLPISTTHALVGGLAGAGILFAPSELSWSALGGSYFAPLMISPFLAVGTAALLFPLARLARSSLGIEADTCLCIGGKVEPVRASAAGTLFLARTGVELTIAQTALCEKRYSGVTFGLHLHSLVNRLHQISAFSLGFARGLNDTPKILALLVAAGWSGIDPRISLVAIAGAMALGGYLRAGRVAETLAHRITRIDHGQGPLANAISSGLVVGASLAGTPVSTTHVSTGALFGIGIWNRETDWSMVRSIVLAWVGTLPLAAGLASALAWGLR
jgi:inorganic phosphate transporter, PiT family